MSWRGHLCTRPLAFVQAGMVRLAAEAAVARSEELGGGMQGCVPWPACPSSWPRRSCATQHGGAGGGRNLSPRSHRAPGGRRATLAPHAGLCHGTRRLRLAPAEPAPGRYPGAGAVRWCSPVPHCRTTRQETTRSPWASSMRQSSWRDRASVPCVAPRLPWRAPCQACPRQVGWRRCRRGATPSQLPHHAPGGSGQR